MKHEWEKIKDLFYKLDHMLNRQQKAYGYLAFACTILSAIAETIGVSAILPVVQGLMNVDSLWDKWYLKPFVSAFHIERSVVLIYLVCAEVTLVYLFKNLYFIFYTWIVKKYTYKIKRELGTRTMESYMAQGYIFFVENSSAKLMQGLAGDVNSVNTILSGLFNLSAKVLTILAIGIFMIAQEPFVALLLLVLAGLCVTFIQLSYKSSMLKYGTIAREANWENNQACMEAIHGSKEVLVAARQEYFTKQYTNSLTKQAQCNVKIEMASTIPAYLIEMICVVGLLFAVAVKAGGTGVTSGMIESLSVIAVAAFRILPAVGAVTSQLNALRSAMPSFNAAFGRLREVEELQAQQELLNQEKKERHVQETVRFSDKIAIRNVYYKYPNTERYILEDFSLNIKANTSVGIIGSSGSGKTTLMDVLLGLLIPERGTIEMDGIDIRLLGDEWNHNVGYVPQSVYLVNDDIRSNIAFGIPKEQIDDEKVWEALEMAQLADFVRQQPLGLKTVVGERGIKFSGGQRQRVAIARALYGNPAILILDEATAALDNETEKGLMDAIDALQGYKTMVVVAHRLTTIKNCDYIYEVEGGRITQKSKQEVFS
jgi:ABC-type multidrug transport system fused ATPase/permease subunit